MKGFKLLLIVAAIAGALTLPASAKGGFEIVTISGPDWYGEIEITDADLLPSLDMNHFMNLDHPIAAPAQVGRGYLLTRGYVEGSERHMFDRIVYFPGSLGYAYYLEIVNGAGPMDGNWYTVTEDGKQALAAGLARHGVRLPKPVLGPPSERSAGENAAEADELAASTVAKSGEPAALAIAKAVKLDIDSTKAIEPPPFNVGGLETVGMLLGAILLGSVAGWVLRGTRLKRVQPVTR